MKQILAALAGIALAGLALVYFTAPDLLGLGSGGPPRARSGPVVAVASVAPQTFVESIEAIGTARANESVVITAKTADTIGRINFEEGQSVAAGDVLVEMTSVQQAADVAAARAAYDEAQRAFERARDLVSRGIAPQSSLDEARGARDTARSRLDGIEARLADTIIKAPFAGLVGLRNVSVGGYVRPGDVITTLDDTAVIKADFTVPERYLAALKAGLKINASVAAYRGETFAGAVSSVDTRVDPATRAIDVRALVPNPDGRLKPGMLMSVTLIVAERSALAVPESAIVPLGDKRFVFRIGAESRAERIEVTTGLRMPGFVEITGGLNAGDRVVSEGANKVIPGQPVTVQGDAPAQAGPEAGGGRS